MARNFYDLTSETPDGQPFEFSRLKGKAVLIVNTASKCGFTPQYDGLQKLYEQYGDKGLIVLGFPCDQFAHQEPGSDEEIAQFCKVNYGVDFPLMKKSNVNGKDANEVFTYLKEQAHGVFKRIKWNFTKFLVSREGSTVLRFEPTVKPEDIAGEIEKALA